MRYASEDSYFTISYVALNAASKKELYHTRVVHHYASTQYVLPTTRSGSRTCASLQEVIYALREGASSLVSRACPGGPFLSFFQENSLDSGYGFAGSGYTAADVAEDSDLLSDEDEEAISNLKESTVRFPSHLVGGGGGGRGAAPPGPNNNH